MLLSKTREMAHSYAALIKLNNPLAIVMGFTDLLRSVKPMTIARGLLSSYFEPASLIQTCWLKIAGKNAVPFLLFLLI